MNKHEVKGAVKLFARLFRVPVEKVILGAGGAMVMHGLRNETNDVDIEVDQELFDRLLGIGYPTHYFKHEDQPGILVIETNMADVHLRFTPGHCTEMIDGICCYTKLMLLTQKQKLNREKDQEDIKALQNATFRVALKHNRCRFT